MLLLQSLLLIVRRGYPLEVSLVVVTAAILDRAQLVALAYETGIVRPGTGS